jgi:rhodanese-related sulfurtransferase
MLRGVVDVKFVQYYLDCLSQASYLVGDEHTGRAVVVDPRRDIDIYLDDAAAVGLGIELVIETHVHTDFLSGHLELAAASGAEIAYGPGAVTDFPIRHLGDGDQIVLGQVALEVRHTPGHTPESISLVVWEKGTDPAPYGVLTGDTLFIGEVGSACGRDLSSQRSSTIGEQRRTNYALQPMPPDEFITLVTDPRPAPAPRYSGYDADLNTHLHGLLDEHAGLAPMALDEALVAQSLGAVLLDVRPAMEFAAGHLRGSLQVPLDTRFAEFAGSIIGPGTPIVLIGDPVRTADARVRLSRIGYDRVIGFLPDVSYQLSLHPELAVRSSVLSAAQLDERRRSLPDLQVIDVRTPAEVAAGALADARRVPLSSLRDRLDELDPLRPTAIYSDGGASSLIAVSLLENEGFGDVSSVLGGYGAIAASAPV